MLKCGITTISLAADRKSGMEPENKRGVFEAAMNQKSQA